MEPSNKNIQDKICPRDSNNKIFIPLYALAKNKRKLFILRSAWQIQNIQAFIDRNRKTILSSTDLLYVPSFVFKDIYSDPSCKAANFLVHKSKLNVVAEISDLPMLFVKLSTMNLSKGEACFIANNEEESETVMQCAKESKIFVQIFRLTPEGNLQKLTKPESPLKSKHINDSKIEYAQRKLPKNRQGHFLLKTTPELMRVLPILTEHIGTNSVIYDTNGAAVKIGNELISHPNAVTFSTDRQGVSAKIFTNGTTNTFLEKKVERMLSQEIRHKGLCWPIDILRDKVGNFVGYLLPEAKGEPLHLSIFKRGRLQQLFPSWDRTDLCDLSLTILDIVKYLHSRNILLGCINPAAIRVVDKNTVFFLDTDDYQIEGFPTLVHNLTFTPPELLGKKIYLSTMGNDNYGVAILLFMLLMPGKLPYTLGRGQTPEEKILNSRFSFSFKDEYGSHAMPSAWRFMWSHLTPFKPLFYSTFKRGERYSNPEQRRTVEEWIGTLRYYRKELESHLDRESLKLYPETFKRRENDRIFQCTCCRVYHPEFYFYNPQSTTEKICNGCIDKMSEVNFTCHCCHKTYYYTNRTALFHRMRRERDSTWRDQKYCRDCKNKTLKCIVCGKETPYYQLKDGYCPTCNKTRLNSVYTTRTCKDCGKTFSISVGQHESLSIKGLSDPVRCESCRIKRKSL